MEELNDLKSDFERRIKYKIFGGAFEEDYFVKYLKIPFEYVEGFKYYAVENEKFILILESKKIK
jgi:hypothetical protein